MAWRAPVRLRPLLFRGSSMAERRPVKPDAAGSIPAPGATRASPADPAGRLLSDPWCSTHHARTTSPPADLAVRLRSELAAVRLCQERLTTSSSSWPRTSAPQAEDMGSNPVEVAVQPGLSSGAGADATNVGDVGSTPSGATGSSASAQPPLIRAAGMGQHHHEPPTRVSSNGRAAVLQTADGGSIPSTRTVAPVRIW
jgi:hypothetical protein